MGHPVLVVRTSMSIHSMSSRVASRVGAALGLVVLLVALMGVGPAEAQEEELHVDANNTPAACADASDPSGLDGSSWDCAYIHLQDALDRANANPGTDYEIRVAAGTYFPDEDDIANDGVFDGEEQRDHTPDSREEFFTITENNVQLLGGYPSGGGPRDPDRNRTVLSGDIDDNKEGVIEDPSTLDGDNSYHVLLLDGVNGSSITDNTVIDGVFVTGGQNKDEITGVTEGAGGGLLCRANAFSGSAECSPELRDVRFIGNKADEGGAIYLSAGRGNLAKPTIEASLFANNTALKNGGGIYNDATATGGGSGDGGTVNLTIRNTVFVKNATSEDSGNHGGAISSRADASSSGIDGQVTLDIVNTVFLANAATDNSFTNEGGALYTSVGINGSTADVQLTNVTFANNRAGENGGAIFSTTGGSSTTLNLSIRNSILWGDRASSAGDEVFTDGSSPSISYSIVQGGNSGLDSGNAFSNGTGNRDANPRFEYPPRPAGDDGVFGTDDDGLHVTPESPALDNGTNAAGVPSTDLTGTNRTTSPVDIGAYEGERDQPRTIYVDPSATGANDGTSWADADTRLQDPTSIASGALDYATENDEIWVAEGTYTPVNENTSFTITGVQDGLKLYGGFEGTESSRSAREPTVHRTVLSGDLDGGDVDPDNDDIIEDADPDHDGTVENLSGGNAQHVLVIDGGDQIGPNVSQNVTEQTVLSGLYVTAGQADAGSFPDDSGGGLYCDGFDTGNECSPTLEDVVFVGNAADFGGAIYSDGNTGGTSSPQLTDVTFADNAAAGDGGALYNDGGDGTSIPSITNAIFTDNAAAGDVGPGHGGAIYSFGRNGESSPEIVNAVFASNEAVNGGALFNSGNDSGVSSPPITNVVFAENEVSATGGAIHNDGRNGGVSEPKISNTILWRDTAPTQSFGPEIYNEGAGATATLTHSIVYSGKSSIANSGGGTARYLDESGTDVSFSESTNLDQVQFRFNEGGSLAGDDNRLATADDSLGLAPGASALDAGTNAPFESDGVAETVSTDITGASRRQDLDADGTATVNIGPYEVVEARPPTVTAQLAASVTGATQWGDVNPGGAETVVEFRFAPTSFQGPPVVTTDTLRGAVNRRVRGTARRLRSGETYDLTLAAQNAEGQAESVSLTIPVRASPLSLTGTDRTVPIVLRGRTETVPVNASSFFAGKGGAGAFESVSLTTTENDGEGTSGRRVLEATIPDALVTTRGVDYFARFETNAVLGDATLTVPDGAGSTAPSRPLSIPVSFDELSPPEAVREDLFQAETYRMASVPAAVDPKGALTDVYGPYEPVQWRLLQWDAAEDAYREFADLDSTDLTAGNAFWLITEEGTPLSLSGGQTVDASTPRAVELEPGWNQVGTPFGFAVPWDSVEAASGFAPVDLRGPYRRGAEGYQTDTALQPWRGYFVYNATSSADTLRIPSEGTSEKSAPAERLASSKRGRRPGTSGSGYILRVTARSTAGPSTATVGLRSDAKAGWDRYDVPRPPSVRPTTQVSVMPTRKSDGSGAVPHAKSMKPIGGSGQIWTLRLRRPEQGDTPSSVRVDWSAEGTLPEGQSRYVVDPETETRVAPGKRFSLKKGETKRLKVIVGTERYAQKQSAAALQQYETALRGNYPNPFEKQTTLEYTLSEERSVTMDVYNVLGQRVETLVDARTSAGLHTVTWDGTNRYGDRVGSGVYFVRMEAGSTTETQKVVLVR